MDSLIQRLRNHALPDPHDERPVLHADLLTDAANEIERLQSALSKIEQQIASAPVVEPYRKHIGITGTSTEIYGPGWLYGKRVRLLVEETPNARVQAHSRSAAE